MTAVTVSFNEALALAVAALKARGASPAQAQATARAVVTAEAEGNRAVGLSHLFTYGDALADGRAHGTAEPLVEQVTDSVTRVDAGEGLPHLGFERALPRLVEGAQAHGVAIFTLFNGYPCGALGYFVRRLAEEHGLTALAAANAGPAVMAASGGTRPVYCTNPLAFAVPTGPAGDESSPALVIDQSSASASLAKLRQYAEAGREIPEGWALDPAGHPTTDARAALAGTLIPFGGVRGANIALMVELLAAGLTGANWSQEAPPYNRGRKSPGAGLFILAVDQSATSGAVRAGAEGAAAEPAKKAPHENPHDFFTSRLSAWISSLSEDDGVHLPGLQKGETLAHARHRGFTVDAQLWAKIRDLA